MKAKSIKGKTINEIQSALEQCMTDGFKPTLAVVFISINNDLDAVSRLLDEKGIQIFGATSSGEFIDGEFSNGAIAVLLMDMHSSHFKILLQDYRDKDTEVLTREMSKKAKELFNNPTILISTSINVMDESELLLGEPFIKTIESVIGKEAIIWGGRAGDDFAFKETIVFSNQLSTKRGIIMLVLDGDKIQVRGEAASGLKPIGTEKTVTKAIRNWVYEIDHQPAAEMVLKFLGINLTQEEAETFMPREGILFSVAREEGDPVIRGVGLFNWINKSFSTLGTIREGDKIHLTLPPDFELVEEIRQNAEKIKQEEMHEADALLMFSCTGRLSQFGPLIGDEIEGVRKVFNAPMAGFFSYGEYGRTKNGYNDFHASTCCWVALKEKPLTPNGE